MTFPFLEFTFHDLELDDRGALSGFLEQHPHSLSGYTFATLIGWNLFFRYGWCFASPECLLISCVLAPDRDRLHLMQPVGRLDPGPVERLIAAARQLPYPLRITGVDRAFLDANPGFVRHFDVVEERENANYVYGADDLARLPGRAFAGKRNHISQAAHAYRWTVEPLTAANAPEALLVLRDIRREDGMEETKTLREDEQALETTLSLFGDLRQDGILVRVDGHPAGFSIFERQTPSTAVVHFERALRSYKGMHQVVNQAVAQAIVERGYTLVNREEDLGLPGLRRAKMSYHPVETVAAYRLDLRR